MTRQPIRFVRGNRFCQVTPSRDGTGFQGLCNGQVMVRGDEMAATLGLLIRKMGLSPENPTLRDDRPVDREIKVVG